MTNIEMPKLPKQAGFAFVIVDGQEQQYPLATRYYDDSAEDTAVYSVIQLKEYATQAVMNDWARCDKPANKSVTRYLRSTESAPACPSCGADVLYECVACSAVNYPPPMHSAPQPEAMREALRVLQGCLEHPDADSAIAALQAALAPQPQPATQPLTDGQILELWDAKPVARPKLFIVAFARAIESAHGIAPAGGA